VLLLLTSEKQWKTIIAKNITQMEGKSIMPKKLAKAIESKLDKLQTLLDNIEEARHLDSNDPDTWDSDTLYNITKDLKEALKLLQDQKAKQLNQHNEPIIEPGLCSLIDD
jgi:predicted HNH restriction endonuclease